MSIKKLVVILFASIMVLAAGSARALPLAHGAALAQAPEPQRPLAPQAVVLASVFTYQGYLKNTSGPINDTCDFQFSLWDALLLGAQVGATQTKSAVVVSEGLFTVDLDFGASAFTGDGRWLAIAVRCPAGSGAYTPLTLRQPLTAAPYALSLRPGATIYNTATSGTTVGLTLQSTSGDGVAGEAAGVGVSGVYGNHTAASGDAFGVFGRTASTNGRGVAGVAQATTGTAYGVYGASASTDGRGVVGRASAATGTTYGVYGLSDSPSGYGVYGEGVAYGVYGKNLGSGDAVGVAGIADNNDCTIVGGAKNCRGVYGSSLRGVGVKGYSYTGRALEAEHYSGVGVYIMGVGGNLIEGWKPVPPDRKFYVSSEGEVYADGQFHPGGADLAEMLPAVKGLEPGDVLVVGPDGKLARSTCAYQLNVAGVYSTKPGFIGGAEDGADLSGKIPLAVAGIVPVKASTENGPIQPGDALTPSSIAGHAMKAKAVTVEDITFYPSGVIVGKALGSLESGTGVIQMLVILQ